MSNSLRPHESQHARLPCPSPTPGVYSNSCPSSRWCHPGISSSVVPFFSCPQSLPALGSFPMSQLFEWGGQSTGVFSFSISPSDEHPQLVKGKDQKHNRKKMYKGYPCIVLRKESIKASNTYEKLSPHICNQRNILIHCFPPWWLAIYKSLILPSVHEVDRKMKLSNYSKNCKLLQSPPHTHTQRNLV